MLWQRSAMRNAQGVRQRMALLRLAQFGVAILANCSIINDKRFPQIGKRPVLGNLCIKKYQNFKQASNGQANEWASSLSCC